ncbi:MAG: ABC transporter substrate-binding protein [Candidatus Ancillula trichonymphae]|nr:ABC transporter substrate-binding protein [Candidatus Ancillula trichonymphae]
MFSINSKRSGYTLRIAVVALAAVLLPLGLTSCGSKSDSADNMTLSIGLTLAPTNLDIRTTSGAALEQVLLDNIYEGLVTTNEEGKIVPALAEKWTVSSDGLKYTFHLKPNLHFSDERAVDAHDVVDSVLDVKNNKLNGYAALEKLQKAEASDASTVVFELSSPNPEFMWTLAGRAGIVVDKTKNIDYKTTAFGTGPFLLESWDGSTNLKLKRNGNYWGKKPGVEEVNIVYITDKNAAVNALESGTIQALFPIVQKLSTKFENNSKYTIKVAEGTDKFELAFNNANGPLTDVRIRKAIRLAIDHKEFIANRSGVDSALGGPITKFEPGYEDLTSVYPHDETKARELLAEAGYSTDKPLKLTLKYATTVYGSELGELLTSQLKKIGIQLEVTSQDFPTWLDDVYKKHNYELTIVDQNDPRAFFHFANPNYYYGYNSAEVQELYKEAESALTEEKEAELLKKAARVVSEDAVADWLFNYRTTVIYTSNIAGLPINFNQSRLLLKEVHFN